jgi:AhpC/TSA family
MRSFLLLVVLTLWSTHSSQGWTAPQQPPPSTPQLSSASRRAFLQNIPLIATTAAAVVATGSVVLPSIATAADGTAPKHPTLVTGARAPDFELPNSRGEGATSLDQLINSKKWTVLYFYPGAFTQGKEQFLVFKTQMY